MRVIRTASDVPVGFGASAVTVGKFDGVHEGHRAVLRRLIAVARSEDLNAVVLTFDRHPLAQLRPGFEPPALVSLDQKLELLAETGIDAAAVITFDHDFSSLAPDQFVRRMLVDLLDARAVFVGGDFRFGHKAAGTVDTLRALGEHYGFRVATIDDAVEADGQRISSTHVREAMATGDVAHAGRLLGHLPVVRGLVVHGAKRGRELGFPTANLSATSEGLIPADGVYAGWLLDGEHRYPSAVSVGNNPTFAGIDQRQVEAFVLDETLDLYGRVVEVEFVDRVRGMVAFSGVDELIATMHNDVDRVRELLA